MVDGPDQARLGVLMTAGYVLFAVVALVSDRARLMSAKREHHDGELAEERA
jgi:hypothetical protein